MDRRVKRGVQEIGAGRRNQCRQAAIARTKSKRNDSFTDETWQFAPSDFDIEYLEGTFAELYAARAAEDEGIPISEVKQHQFHLPQSTQCE
ncbi:hypothetical protein [Pigmentiphaga sp. H8]|uniref:hypothetical protein n=1 Tax=Pigmentiphaga sp. H8 TaxID=2488560 RepID=UPI0013754F74|nr:hypothetical protein [Pigmentiphaga sp. H8]